MSFSPATSPCEIALQHHQAGRLAEAQRIYREILLREPDHADALHLLGVLASQQGRGREAVELIARAIAAAPAVAAFHSNLGKALCDVGEAVEGERACRRAIELRHEFPEAYNNLGNALRLQDRKEEALAAYRRAIELRPGLREARQSLWLVLADCGRLDEAMREFTAVQRLGLAGRTDDILAFAVMLREAGKLEEAIAVNRALVAMKGDYAEAWCNLGDALLLRGMLEDSVAASREALRLRPDLPEAHLNLGNALQGMGRLDESIIAYREAIRLRPAYAEAYSNLGNSYKGMGQIDEAIEAYRSAVRLNPRMAGAHSNLVYVMHFRTGATGREILQEHRQWAAQHADALRGEIAPHDNTRDPDRRIRVGYVSADFRQHPVGRFLLPLLSNHDHANFEVVCYSDAQRPDAVTAQIKALADRWHDTRNLSDAALADLIRQEGIDILVDLSLHLADNRMLTFARKPAPLQATYLAYAGTSGLETMDWRITDAHLDPPGEHEDHYTEKSIRIASYWCYQPLEESPEVGPLPAATNGYLSFGCLNHFGKVGEPALQAWAQLLAAMPTARLIIHSAMGSHQARVLEMFRDRGVAERNVEFVPKLPTLEYLSTYNRIDIALDPFPYNGGTTTCDALWMGCPVVSLAGDIAVARAGVSLLNQVGLGELVALDVQQYVTIARRLAEDRARLTELRCGMRERMKRSPLCDAPRFAREMEAAYRHMWRTWCMQ